MPPMCDLRAAQFGQQDVPVLSNNFLYTRFLPSHRQCLFLFGPAVPVYGEHFEEILVQRAGSYVGRGLVIVRLTVTNIPFQTVVHTSLNPKFHNLRSPDSTTNIFRKSFVSICLFPLRKSLRRKSKQTFVCLFLQVIHRRFRHA